MLTYTLRRLLLAIPTLLFIALVIFLILELAPGDPMADQPMTIPPEVREQMRAALGLDQPWWVRFALWLRQFFWVEPLTLVDHLFGTGLPRARRGSCRGRPSSRSWTSWSSGCRRRCGWWARPT